MNDVTKVTPLEGWSIDLQRKTVRYRGDSKMHGTIIQTSQSVIRDEETGEPVEIEVQHLCQLSSGQMVIVDETEPW